MRPSEGVDRAGYPATPLDLKGSGPGIGGDDSPGLVGGQGEDAGGLADTGGPVDYGMGVGYLQASPQCGRYILPLILLPLPVTST